MAWMEMDSMVDGGFDKNWAVSSNQQGDDDHSTRFPLQKIGMDSIPSHNILNNCYSQFFPFKQTMPLLVVES